MAKKSREDDFEQDDFEEIEEEDLDEENDRRRRRRIRRDVDEEGDATGGVIPYKNAPALIAYYCAIFSLIPCAGLLLGIAAVILGFVGLSKYKQNPRVHGVAHAWIGIVLGGLTFLGNIAILVLAAIGFFAARK